MVQIKRYERYKDSGVEWIGEIPEGWEQIAISRLFQLGRGRVISKEEIEDNIGDYPVYSSQTENDGELGRINTFDFDGEYLTWTTDGANAGTVFYRSGKFNCTNVCGTMKPKQNDINLSFVRYALSIQTKRHVRIDINPKLMNNEMSKIRIFIPGHQEQTQIANFLDQKTAEIDSLIADKEKLIALLEEQRQAIITEAVTKGLNPDVKMKDSGVEWIGEIPEHWKVRKVKYVFDNLDYKRIPLSSEERGTMENKIYDYYGASGKIDLVEDYIFDDTLILIGEDGANLYSRSTPLAFIASGKFWVNNHAHILKPKEGNIFYFVNLLESIDYTTFITGSAQPKLTQERLGSIFIPVPPNSEQNKIAEFIERKENEVTPLIEEVKNQINKLKEYRQSLIFEAVTGKIDVRDVAVETTETA